MDRNGISLNVTIDKSMESLNLHHGHTIIDLLKDLGIRPDSVLVMRDGQPIPITETVIDDDHIKIIRVASGG